MRLSLPENGAASGRREMARRTRLLLLATTALAGTAICGVEAVPAQPAGQSVSRSQYTFDIRRQSLASAVVAFSRVTGTSVISDGGIPPGAISPGVSGTHSPEAALRQLLDGTGLTYTISGRTIRIVDPALTAAGGAPADGDTIQLDTIDVTSRGVSGGMTPDTPFETAGSSTHVSQEQLSRVPPTSPGDMFSGTPGVLNGGNRVGTSLNPNIRGLQGMGRVNTTVDGALNSSTSYRGYTGTRDETYVDPDMIGGIDITKGPSDGVGAGGIGGNINMRTLAAQDLVKDGDNWGVRFKGSVGSNTRTPPHNDTSSRTVTRDTDRPSFFNGDSWSGSVAAATFQDNFEGVLAFSKRQQGNYFAGKQNVPDGFVFPEGNGLNPGRNAIIRPGGEVYNTSEDTESILAKGKLKWGDGQSFELGYMRYDSTAGEEDEALVNNLSFFGQRKLSRTQVDTYTARYRHESLDNPLVNLRANLWHTNLDHNRGDVEASLPQGARDHDMATTGGDLSNRAIIDTAFGALTLDGGAEFRHEHAEAPDQIAGPGQVGVSQTSRSPNGFRTLTSGFAKASFEPTDWLEVSAGARLDHYEAEGEGVASVYPDRSGSRLSPNFSAVVEPFEGIQLYAQYKEGYRPPSLRELYWELYTLQVNPDLKGEVSKNWEFGFNVLRDDVLTEGDKVRFKASYFRNRYDDFIVVDNVPGNTSQQHFTNIDRANYHGVELSGSYDAGKFFVEGAFTKYLTAEYCTPERGCYLPQLNETLANVTPPNYVPPDWSGSVTAGMRLFDEALTFGARVQFSSTRIGTDWPPPPREIGLVGMAFTWPEFVVFDLFGTYKFNEDTSLSLSIENVTDQYYYGPLATTGMPSPGRTARVSLTHRIGGDGFWRVPELPALGRASEGAPGDNWTGLYVGGHYGFASADVSGTVTTSAGGYVSPTEAADYSDDGRIGGAQIGYNHQFDNRLILGVEGDFSVLNKGGAKTGTLPAEFPDLAAAGYLESETEYSLDWAATLRGRIGYSFGRFMVYGTGGLALSQQSGTRTQYRSNRLTTAAPDPTSTEHYFSETDSATSLGWTVGAGVEYALANNWTLKGEYSYADYGSANLRFGEAREGIERGYQRAIVGEEPLWPGGPPLPVYGTLPGPAETAEGRKASNDAGVHTIKLGLNYRF